ncbi:cation-translocating P-type ATPase [Streptomyces heilongjiangensis]|uniref:HAD-IC family P-type ATPase n=1 Tax=Streptomyces heilongjiangensis TaxID=945052 RepID=A0ABW1B4Q8_9ACTN|nr:cation-translocating P-type ATPase [Streptomyces heilongjiangensis]MDC2947800.1 cation-translocating P-type ATPase [Streptomyces heilongjiangensis]
MARGGRWGDAQAERGSSGRSGLLTRPTAAATGLALAGPRLLARGAGPAVGLAAGAVAGTARAGVRSADSAVRVARTALPRGARPWRSGARAHLALRPETPERVHREGGTEHAARKVAAALAERPDVAFAYWDRGLARLVVAAAEEALGDTVVDEAVDLAARHGLRPADEDADEGDVGYAHPGDPAATRAAAAALAADTLGAGVALAGSFLRLPRSPRLVTAVVTLLRENPRFRAFLRDRLGPSRMDVLLATANAAVHGAGQTPIALLLDGALRACQLGESLARATAFDTVHDQVCTPRRVGPPPRPSVRPPLRSTPAQDYASHASTGSVLGAAATLLVKHDGKEAAEAVLSGSPKAARYGPAAFHHVLGAALARGGVLVRDPERLRRLETVDTVVLHSSALRDPGAGADPWAETVLDAARRARLAVVMVDDPALRDFTGLADQVVTGDRPLREVVRGLRDEGATVLTVARFPSSAPGTGAEDTRVRDDATLAPDDGAPAGDEGTDVRAGGALDQDRGGAVRPAAPPAPGGTDLLDGLLAGDVAVALTDRDSAVVWGADVLALNGPADVWRLLTAVPAARAVSRRSQTLARSGAALSGLLVAVGETHGARRHTRLPGLRHVPVDVGAATALLSGVRGALGVALARAPHPRPRTAWHALPPDDVLDRLDHAADEEERDTTVAEQAAGRLHEVAETVGHTPAAAPVRWTVDLARAVRGELDDPLTPVLAVGSAASAILGSVVDALLVFGALDLNALVGGLQRLRAERALSGLLADQQRKARVAPLGPEEPTSPPAADASAAAETVDAAVLDPGDVIELEADDVVPADARLLWEDGLEVDESALTGESLPVDKQTAPTPRAPVADRSCMVFEGTTVVAGQARAVVVGTGDRTEAARAVALAARTPPSAGVQAKIHELTRKALPLTLAGGAAVTGLSLLRGTPIRESVSGGVAVAVAAVPEGLPLVATVAQLSAARRLSRRGVLVRTPRTLEALGRMDTVCFDKTGTLTENRLRLVRVGEADGTVRTVEDTTAGGAARTLRVAARACPRLNGGSNRPVHATDEAVLDAAGPDPRWAQTEGRPFEAARGYAASVGATGDGTLVLVVKGAPETVLPACPELPDHASGTAQSLARDGLRVLAVAERPLRAGEEPSAALEAPLEDLEFTGLIALADVPRETSTELVRGLREAGVRPVMLTGDHPQTARAIAAQLGWPEDTTVVTGDELACADRSVRARLLRDTGVVARVAPEQKLQVVEALRDAGRVVGMVGDGANDAAAIRAADIGVGIQARGSAAARNAADLVLTDDDLSVLIEVVAEGRSLWHSVTDAVAILVGGNAGEVGFGILGTLLAGRAPLSTRQMLLVNLFTDLFPAMAVAVTPKEEPGTANGGGTEGAAPGTEPLGTGLLGAPLMRQIRHRALTTCLGATLAWLAGRFTPGTARRSTTMALCGVVGTQLAQTLVDRRHSPLVRTTALGSAAALVVLVQIPGASHFFGCTPLGPLAWAGVAAAIALAAAGQRALPDLERTVQRLVRSRSRAAAEPSPA